VTVYDNASSAEFPAEIVDTAQILKDVGELLKNRLRRELHGIEKELLVIGAYAP
jgi:hypothetical protein